MKKLLAFFLGMTLIVSMTTMSSCKKEDDDSKYQEKGNYGNANITTTIFSVNPWQNDGFKYYTNHTDPSITSSVQSNGTVDIFLSIDNGTTWQALPFTQLLGCTTPNYYQMGYITSLNSVQIQWIYFGSGLGVDPNTFFSNTCQFKVVVATPL